MFSLYSIIRSVDVSMFTSLALTFYLELRDIGGGGASSKGLLSDLVKFLLEFFCLGSSPMIMIPRSASGTTNTSETAENPWRAARWPGLILGGGLSFHKGVVFAQLWHLPILSCKWPGRIHDLHMAAEFRFHRWRVRYLPDLSVANTFVNHWMRSPNLRKLSSFPRALRLKRLLINLV